MKKLIMIIFTVCVTQYLFAQNQWCLQGGVTYSAFKDDGDVDPSFGYLFGISKEIKLIKNLFISPGLQYMVKGSAVKNVPIKPRYYFPDGGHVYNHDIVFRAAFIEIPVHLKYKISITNTYTASLNMGYTYSIPFKDKSKIIEKEYLFTIDILDDHHFDYYFTEGSVFGNIKSALLFNLGIELLYKNIGLNLTYTLDEREEFWCDSIHGTKKKLHIIWSSAVIFKF